MQKVMKKLRAKPLEEASETLVPAETAPDQADSTPTDPAPGDQTAFAPDPAAMQIPNETEPAPAPDSPANTSRTDDELLITNRTIEWDANNLDPSLVTYFEKYSSTSEQYRSLRARLLNMNSQLDHQMIGVTSSLPQEGKSVTTLNLGMVMAEGRDQNILVIDGDFRRASIAHMLGISPKPGLAELIRGEADLAKVIRPTHNPNLKIITCGGIADKNYGELLGAASVGPVLKRLRRLFDYSFLDTPPVNTVSDVSMLAPHCDGVVLVIEMRKTPEPSVLEAVRTLQTTNVKIMGCLLSHYDDQRGHYYERYYNYYYHNG